MQMGVQSTHIRFLLEGSRSLNELGSDLVERAIALRDGNRWI
jgi:hypothetical protein